jgi:hypothetical protein
MTIGATTTFQETRDEICTDALVNLGAVAPGKSASDARTSALLTHAARALNRLVKSMDSEGQFLWRIQRRTKAVSAFDLLAGQSFTLAADVLDVDEPLRYAPSNGSQPTPILAMSRDEWMVADQTSTGTPNRYYVERSLDGLSIYLSPISTDTTATVEYPCFIRAADFNSGAETPDFLQKWTACLVYGLTAELAATYGQPQKIGTFRQLFEAEKARLQANNAERGGLTLVPFWY